MNTKVARQIEEMKKQTIGVEVEMNSITREKAAKTAAEYFGTRRYQSTASRNGYSTWSAWDTDGREWKFQKDVSISGPDSEKCELVTPILHYSDIELLQELIRRLRKAGAKSDATRGCGVHIHIGANGHTAQTLRNLANLMASHERLIATALKINEGRMSRYCRTVNPNFLAKLNSKKPKTGQSEFPRKAQQQKAENNEPACRHLVRGQRCKLRQKPPLQRQPLPYAQPPRNLYKRHG